MTEPSQLFTDDQQCMIIEDMRVLLSIYSRETIPKIHHYEYDKYLWSDIYSHIHIQMQHLFDDSIQDMEKKVKRALSGGQPTVEEHRRLGGDCEKDVAFQYLHTFFESEDSAIEEIRREYSSGRMLAAEIKKICIDKASEWLNELLSLIHI